MERFKQDLTVEFKVLRGFPLKEIIECVDEKNHELDLVRH